MHPKISVLIPVFKTSQYLAECLQHIRLTGSFLLPKDVEIVLVNDGSFEERKICKKELKFFTKETKIPHQYIEHRKNLGLIEARRTGLENANGSFIVFCDPDDHLIFGALESFYEEATKSQAEIIQGKILTDSTEKDIQWKTNLFLQEKIVDTENQKIIFEKFLIHQELSGFLWGKLYKKSLLEKVFALIPHCYCVMAEDLLVFFIASYFATSYSYVESPVYFYNFGRGISSNNKVVTLARWERICSSSTVFTILKMLIPDEIQLSENQAVHLQRICNRYLQSLINRLEKYVDSSIKESASEILNEYWGEKYVAEISNFTTKTSQ